MLKNEYRRLISHMEWADAQIWKSVLSLPSLHHDDWLKEHLHHYHSTQWAYGQILLKLPLMVPELSAFPDIRSLGLWVRRFYGEVSPKLAGCSEEQYQQNVEFPFAEKVAERLGSVSPATVGESIIQLALHSAHHRGQIVVKLREAGGEPPVTDFIAWVWMRCPAADWGNLSDG